MRLIFALLFALILISACLQVGERAGVSGVERNLRSGVSVASESATGVGSALTGTCGDGVCDAGEEGYDNFCALDCPSCQLDPGSFCNALNYPPGDQHLEPSEGCLVDSEMDPCLAVSTGIQDFRNMNPGAGWTSNWVNNASKAWHVAWFKGGGAAQQGSGVSATGNAVMCQFKVGLGGLGQAALLCGGGGGGGSGSPFVMKPTGDMDTCCTFCGDGFCDNASFGNTETRDPSRQPCWNISDWNVTNAISVLPCFCEPDCGSAQPVCGNGIIEGNEQCDINLTSYELINGLSIGHFTQYDLGPCQACDMDTRVDPETCVCATSYVNDQSLSFDTDTDVGNYYEACEVPPDLCMYDTESECASHQYCEWVPAHCGGYMCDCYSGPPGCCEDINCCYEHLDCNWYSARCWYNQSAIPYDVGCWYDCNLRYELETAYYYGHPLSSFIPNDLGGRYDDLFLGQVEQGCVTGV